MNILSFNHPLDNLEPPEIVDTIVESRPVYSYGEGWHDLADKWQAIHVVGKNKAINVCRSTYNFEGAQYKDVYNTLVDICKASGINCRGVEVHSAMSPDGARGYIGFTFPSETVETGRGDTTSLELTALNSFDGSWPVKYIFGGNRAVCTNKQVFVDTVSFYSGRHTKNLNLGRAKEKMKECIVAYHKEADRWSRWKENSITDKEAIKGFAKVSSWKFVLENPDKTPNEIFAETEVRRNRAFNNLWKQYTVERETLGSNHWAVYNAMTHWATHGSFGKKTNENNILKLRQNRFDSVQNNLVLLAA